MATKRERLSWAWNLDSYGGPWRHHLRWMLRAAVWATVLFMVTVAMAAQHQWIRP
jgi:hypothetical protein